MNCGKQVTHIANVYAHSNWVSSYPILFSYLLKPLLSFHLSADDQGFFFLNSLMDLRSPGFNGTFYTHFILSLFAENITYSYPHINGNNGQFL